jgi:hypothetical protein
MVRVSSVANKFFCRIEFNIEQRVKFLYFSIFIILVLFLLCTFDFKKLIIIL